MYRRQQFDRVDPRKVLPSRHTLFIRGLAGSTDVARVKEFFSEETGSKCSVDFFSMTEDRKRLGVAIRFKSNELAREMLTKYNNKNVLGCPVEITWFKDLKKARAKMFEEQRQSGGRHFQRGFRNNRNSTGERGMISTSPGHQYDNRRARAGSSSSGGGAGYRSTANRERYSLSRSRSFTGSSSRSRSRSAHSKSRSASNNRRPHQQMDDAFRNDGRGFLQPENRRFGQNQPRRSRSGSSSSAVSSSVPQAPGANNTGPRGQRYNSNRGVASPLNYCHPSRRDGEIHGSPNDKSRPFTAFSNAPAPEMDGGSSLVSGLIQLKRRNPPVQAQTDQSADRFQNSSTVHRRQRSLGTSSSSGMSREGSRGGRLTVNDSVISSGPTASGARATNVGKRVNSPSPPFSGTIQRQRPFTKSGFEMADDSALGGFSNVKRSKRVSSSPDSRSSLQKNYNRELSPLHTGMASKRGHSPGFTQLSQSGARATGRRGGRTSNVTAESEEDSENRLSVHNRSPLYSTNNTPNLWTQPDTEPDDSTEVKKRKLNSKPPAAKERTVPDKIFVAADENFSVSDDGSGDDAKAEVQRTCASDVPKEVDAKTGASESEVVDNPKVVDVQPEDAVELIRQRKEVLAQDYKRDCEAFTTVVRTLISKDADLEAKLMPMLKEILHERGQRCIEELRSFIASTNESGVGGNVDSSKDGGAGVSQEAAGLSKVT